MYINNFRLSKFKVSMLVGGISLVSTLLPAQAQFSRIAFFKRPLSTCASGSQAFGTGASSNSNDGTYTFTVPTGCTSITIKAWGAGGSSNSAQNGFPDPDGGGGGFAQGTLAVTPGQQLTVVIGSGGRSSFNSSYGYNTGVFGGPGVDTNTGEPNGGGYSGVHNSTSTLTQANALVIAGGGGGGGLNNASYDGGGGGGSSGQNGAGFNIGTGGTQLAGGTHPTDSASDGSALLGGEGNYAGGGGGYFGGGAGSIGGGGGGSGFITATASSTTNTAATDRLPANTGDSDYASPAGEGGIGSNAAPTNTIAGRNGRVVISY